MLSTLRRPRVKKQLVAGSREYLSNNVLIQIYKVGSKFIAEQTLVDDVFRLKSFFSFITICGVIKSRCKDSNLFPLLKIYLGQKRKILKIYLNRYYKILKIFKHLFLHDANTNRI